ncbi:MULTISPECIES: hypothetical protein [Pseudofrankia]|uniref:hypothetical protein n=1 Tax=Pseudofrankia TaxID=2994363 RepID=UPI000488E21D|nr:MULTISPECIES: hypothetical protein [Pseudofrankia]OHV27654.1 hypothetical protein BCD49_38665 [Pseudofrankia sp. EUN1h]
MLVVPVELEILDVGAESLGRAQPGGGDQAEQDPVAEPAGGDGGQDVLDAGRVDAAGLSGRHGDPVEAGHGGGLDEVVAHRPGEERGERGLAAGARGLWGAESRPGPVSWDDATDPPPA